MINQRCRSLKGFTLLEILVVIAIAAILAAVAVPAWASARERGRQATCLTKLKSFGTAIHLYTQDHSGEFPRSFHSAGSYQEPGWAASIMPYLGVPSANSLNEWKSIFNKFFRCPKDSSTDPSIYSYGMNVFFELSPGGDDYQGSPATWRRSINVPNPGKTILLAETRPIAFGDHFMCHQWSTLKGARNAVDSLRHGKTANYLFVDGHVEYLSLEMTFDPSRGINRWNPSLAQ